MTLKKIIARIHHQAGYTLIELLVVVAILGLLGAAINAGITHTVKIGAHGSEYMTAIKQVEAAMQWMTKDIQQAQTINLTAESGFPMDLYWVEWDGTTHSVTYSLSGTDLVRNHTIDTDSTIQTTVARYVVTTGETMCWFVDKGSFNLPDAGDSFTIYAGAAEDDGLVIANTGDIVTAVTGNATFESGTWSAADDGNIVITAESANTRGLWTSTNINALVLATNDADGDITLTGNAIMVRLSARGGDNSQKTETRLALLFPRSRM